MMGIRKILEIVIGVAEWFGALIFAAAILLWMFITGFLTLFITIGAAREDEEKEDEEKQKAESDSV